MGALLVWLAVALLGGVIVGRAVRLADEMDRGIGVRGVPTTARVPACMIPGSASPAARFTVYREVSHRSVVESLP